MTNRGPEKIEVLRSQVPPTLTKGFLEHKVSYLRQTGQLQRLDTDKNCPDQLKGNVIVGVLGTDSGKGYTRVALRLANRKDSNAGEKEFVLCGSWG